MNQDELDMPNIFLYYPFPTVHKEHQEMMMFKWLSRFPNHNSSLNAVVTVILGTACAPGEDAEEEEDSIAGFSGYFLCQD